MEEHQQPKQEEQTAEEEEEEGGGMTYDEFSMKSSSDFLVALQELKNLRPQLYFAADYFENSYLENTEKRKVLQTSRDYAVEAIVNAVDHLGNVAFKLNELINKESVEVDATELRIQCLKQRFSTCKDFVDGDGLRQQCLIQTFPRFHKHYVLPDHASHESKARMDAFRRLDEVSGSSTPSSSNTLSVAATPVSFVEWKEILEGATFSSSQVNTHKSNSNQHPAFGKRIFSSFLGRRKSSKKFSRD